MVEPKPYLKQWFQRFLQHKDMIVRKIVAFTDTAEGFHVQLKDREVDVIIAPDLKEALGKLKDGWLTVVTLHNDVNRKVLIAEWKSFAAKQKLTIYFVNPFASQETKWVIVPHTHDKICDTESLVLGLTSMGELIEPISVDELERRHD